MATITETTRTRKPSRAARRWVGIPIVVLLLGVGVSACGEDEQAAGTSGCDKPLAAPGEYEGELVVGDATQAYWMIVPESYAESTPAQLELQLATGHGDHTWALGGARHYIDPAGVLSAIVNTSAGPHRTPEMLASLIDHLGEQYCVDANRIHVVGFSSSQTLAAELACVASDRVASVSSSMGDGPPTMPCSPGRAVPLISFTGDTDRAGMQPLIEMWADLNGCDPEPVVEDLGSGVSRTTYQGCEADVVFYDIEGLGHKWPMRQPHGPLQAVGYAAQYDEVDYFEATYEFFADHPMP